MTFVTQTLSGQLGGPDAMSVLAHSTFVSWVTLQGDYPFHSMAYQAIRAHKPAKHVKIGTKGRK